MASRPLAYPANRYSSPGITHNFIGTAYGFPHLLLLSSCLPLISKSKVWCTYHDRVEENLHDTLRKLGTDYLDREYVLSVMIYLNLIVD